MSINRLHLTIVIAVFSHFCFFGILSLRKKPDNIGFDVRGDVKIFDFGLAREFPPDGVMVNGTYLMSGKTGT